MLHGDAAVSLLCKAAMLACGVAIVVAAKAVFAIARRSAVLSRQFSGPPPTSLLFGNLTDFASPQRHILALKWANTYGSMVYMRVAWLSIVCVSDPAIAAEVLHGRDFDKEIAVYNGITRMMSSSGHPDLVTGATDNWWRLFRKGLAPAFSPANIRKAFGVTSAACAELTAVLQRLGSAGSVDIDQALLCESMDLISRFAFGTDFGAIAKFGRSEVAELMDILHRAELEAELQMGDPLRQFTWWLTAEGRRAVGSYAQFQAIMRQLLADLRQRLGPDPPLSDQSIGAHMLRLRDPATGRPLPDERLLPHIGMVFFAGHDTSGHTMAWTLFFIATHPEVEANITAELAARGLLVTPKQPQPRDIAFDDLSELRYLGAAIKESMRLKPVVASGTLRISKQDCTLGNARHHIPAGTGLWVALAAFNTRANWGPTADQYVPERWLQPGADYSQTTADADRDSRNGQDDPKPAAVSADRSFEMNISRAKPVDKVKRFIPFSDGRRDCIGQALAKMNNATVLATLLSRFHFELAPEAGGPEGVAAKEHMAMTLQPGGGLRMLVTHRASMV